MKHLVILGKEADISLRTEMGFPPWRHRLGVRGGGDSQACRVSVVDRHQDRSEETSQRKGPG